MSGSTSLDRFRGLPLSAQAAIDTLCTEFERAWRDGEPALEAYLARVAPAHQSALLAELLAMEVEIRRRRGEQPAPDRYTSRFPAHQSVVREVFRLPPPAAPEPAALPTVPGYEVLGEIGRGGMGVVYKARHLVLNRPVALKMLRPDRLDTLEQRVRFRLEAEAVAALRHPNIVQVYETGEADGRPFLAFELVEGGSLDKLTGRPLPPRDCAAVVETLARAVHYAHGCGVVHRDLKPANVLLSGERRAVSGEPDEPSSLTAHHSPLATPKIADFGLARHVSADSRRTAEGLLAGTPAYMAPEQADPDGPPAGPPADIYALGVILYELLTGEVPHQGRTSLETLALVASREPVPPRKRHPGVPRDLNTVCLKCLEKDPARRYASAAALADDLRAYLDGRPVAARPVGLAVRAWKWARRRPALAAALAAVVGLLLAVAVGSAAAVARLDRQHTELLAERERAARAEQDRRLALAESLLTASPDSVPFILEALAPAAEEVRPHLAAEFDAGREPTRRLRAAVGLTVLGEPRTEFLLAAVPDAPAAESRNLARALRAAGSPEVADRLRAAAETPDLGRRARSAILLLDLGDPRAAAAMLAGGADPTPRTVLIDEFRTWHGDLAELPGMLRGGIEPDGRSGLCAAVGGVDPAGLSADVRRDLTAALAELYRTAPDPGTHAAAGWALRQWQVPPPELTDAREPNPARGWFVSDSGLTMVAVPPGAFSPSPPTVVVVGRPYYLCDREVPAVLYQEFLADPARPPEARPARWPDGPVNEVTRDEMLLFCNWLSGREGRQPCYRRGPDGWACDFDADGYRLPTEAEWDHAHRAGAATAFAFGDDPRWLAGYAHVASRRTAPGASKRPNRWGLFDLTGNVWEVCWDRSEKPLTGLLVDPVVPAGSGPVWVMRGGAFDSGAYDTGVDGRNNNGGRSHTVGFRVACSGPPAAALDPSGACGLAIAALPDHPLPYLVRGALSARKARWPEAAADLGRVWDLNPAHHDAAYECAPLLLAAGDGEGYRRHVRRMIERFGETRNPMVAERTAKACLLAAVGEPERAAAEKLATFAVEAPDPPWLVRYAELARGMAAYRAGEFAAALDWLGKSRSGGRAPLHRTSDAVAGLYEAMALHRLGRSAEARAAFDRAAESMAEDFRAVRAGELPAAWHDAALVWVAYREAEAVLSG